MSSLNVVHRKTSFIVIQPLNTLDTEIQYMCNVFTRYYAQKYSLYCSAMIEHTGFEMQYFCNVFTRCYVVEYNRHRNAVFCDIITACCAQKNSVYCDEAFQYIGHRNAIFLMPSLDGLLRKTTFVELQQLNTSDTEKQYLCNVFIRCFAKKYSIYCGAMIEYKGASKCNIL